MLDVTRAMDFTPGTNVRWQVTGANWTFALPSLAVDRVVCIGAPPPAARATLARIAGDVTVVPAGAGDLERLGFARGTVPLVAVCDRAMARAVWDDPGRLEAIRRILTPGGRLFLDAAPRGGRGPGGPTSNGAVQALWLTPLSGEAHTVVPADDRKTIDYVLDHRLYSLSSPALKRAAIGALARAAPGVRRRWNPGPAGAMPAPSPTQLPGVDDPASRHRPVGASRPAAANGAAAGGRGWSRPARAAERFEHAATGKLRWTPRRGAMVAAVGERIDTSPPAYLVDLARAAGVDLTGWRWGLVARGAYGSRKVLAYLFEPAAAQPSLIVKLTRDAAFNARLENEARALRTLDARGIGADGTLPRVGFEGHHGGLAVVGETIVDGAPFRARTRATTDCLLAQAAVEWLVDLGARTVDRSASPGEAGAALQDLWRRFEGIYTLDAAERVFMAAQVDAVARQAGPFPAVFMHGDPGTWNLVATPEDRVAFLDWEAAEPHGMPLWDLFYFLRSYAVGAARAAGTADALDGFRAEALGDTPLAAWCAGAVARGREACGVAPDLVAPLFYTCWMHRALKEATRLEPRALATGHYVSLLRACIARRDSPALRRLFGEA